jgi:NDP-sugar pyrophosphorylase family protein
MVWLFVRMKYAIIAAGEGSRLAEEGIQVPKPLVRVAGEQLVDRLIRIFRDCGATEVCIICNQLTSLVSDHLAACRQQGWPVRYIQKTTSSSMHSMYELAPLIDDDEPFVLTTVDTIFREEEFRAYVEEWQRLADSGEADGLMGVTDYIDDEKPLYVETEDGLGITAFLDKQEHPHYISGGIYGLTPRSLQTLRQCIERGESRMRNFQRALIADGLRLKAYPFSKVLDIDHASDIQKAEEFLAACGLNDK